MIIILQILVAVGIFNVWVLRYNKKTNWRGGNSKNMKEEFATYGLPMFFMQIIRFTKISLAILLIIGIRFPVVVFPSALILSFLMLGAMSMHFKVRDPIMKSIPALTMFILSALIVLKSLFLV